MPCYITQPATRFNNFATTTAQTAAWDRWRRLLAGRWGKQKSGPHVARQTQPRGLLEWRVTADQGWDKFG